MPEKVKVSIVMQSYNHAEYIRESIESVLKQTFRNFELIIIDDASTDESWPIINGYTDPRIRTYRNETPKRVENARQAISEFAQGEYIAIQHSDDIWEPEKLEKQVAFLDANPQIGAVFSWAQIIDEDGLPFQDQDHFYYKIFEQPNRTRFEWLNYFFYHGNALCHPSVLIRKSCYADCGLYRYGLAQLPDFDMWVRLCLKYEIYVMQEKLVQFRVRSNDRNVSANRPDKRVREQFEYIQVINNYRNIKTPAEFIKIFPSAQKYFMQDEFDIDFALGMLALELDSSAPAKLLGLELLFRALNDPERARRIDKIYQFDQMDFFKLTATHDVFASELVGSLRAQVTEAQQTMIKTQQAMESLTIQLAEITNSTAWKLVQPFRQLRRALIPHGSQREISWNMFLKSLRILKAEGVVGFIRAGFHYVVSRGRRVSYSRLPKRATVDRRIYYANDITQKVLQAFPAITITNPDVSIIIPVYNHLDDTTRCLLSIALASEHVTYEVIVADDASTDGTSSFVSNCHSLRYIRSEQNHGFLRNCNHAAEIARGKYILFLNNDVIVTPGWLDSLIETFEFCPKAGLIGSKLLYPDGSLQEAGGVVWEDGTGLNYGRNEDPRGPKYNYLREVDYCSGACIMIPHNLWKRLGGFDESFTPAYYEDTDLAFRVRQAGYGVIYQPLSQVFHVEGTTSGTDITTGVKHYQEINRQKFMKRWKDTIQGYGTREASNESKYRNRYRRYSALFIDANTPTPDQDSGSIDAFNFMRMLRVLGFAVSFIPSANLLYWGRYTADLQKIGIECQYSPFISSVEDYLKNEGKWFDLIILSRGPIAFKYIDAVRLYAPHAQVIFNTVDLHFLREEREAGLNGSGVQLEKAKETREQEISVMRKADQTILVSEDENRIIHEYAADMKTTVIPIPREIPGRVDGFEHRRDILFLGGYNHPPNIDAVLFFVEEIWPLIKGQIPDCKFLIAGSNMPEKIKRLSSEDIVILGHISELGPVFSKCRLSVAPLRYGAGVKGKIVTSLSFGVPCVATSIATEGMGLTDGVNILVADSPEKFANATVNIYNSSELWEKLSDKGLKLVEERYSLSHVQEQFSALLQSLGLGCEKRI